MKKLNDGSDGIIKLLIPVYKYDLQENPFVGLSSQRARTYEVSRNIDIAFLHKYIYQDIIVCGLQSGKFVKRSQRDKFVKSIKDSGGLPIHSDEGGDFEVLGMAFAPFMTFHTTDALFKLYHTTEPYASERPHYPLDVWIIYDANAYEQVSYDKDFRTAYVLREGYSRPATILGIAQIN